MILGSGSHQAGRRRFVRQAATGAAMMLLGIAALTGCGGSSGDHSNPNPTPTPVTTAVINGRIIENNTAANVAGATVTFNNASVTTGSDGTFSFSVPSGTAGGPITVTLPAGYFSFGYINGQQVTLANGLNISTVTGSATLTAGQTVSLGDIKVFSSDGPPPPPVFN